ncbi:hypothetical protein ALC53_10718 [Atta colombica]|uniref:Uncharacterized protein n=1 Tax=Atta colombica TaxID=520822 RepID=A0A151HZW8_9HYME|nr:hypothetical protein ALC53_10718 [Atta colombica]
MNGVRVFWQQRRIREETSKVEKSRKEMKRLKAVAATLNSISSPASLLPCTGGLVSAPALGPVVAGTSLRTPPSWKSLSTKSEQIRQQSPSQVQSETAWDQKNPTPSTNHVSFEQIHCLLDRVTIRLPASNRISDGMLKYFFGRMMRFKRCLQLQAVNLWVSGGEDGMECTLEDPPLRKLKGGKGLLALSITSKRAGSQLHPIRRNIGRAGLIKIFLESDYTNVSWPRLRDACRAMIRVINLPAPMAFELCYDGAGYAQVSITFILNGVQKVAAPRKQLPRASSGLEMELYCHLLHFAGRSSTFGFQQNWVEGFASCGGKSNNFRIFKIERYKSCPIIFTTVLEKNVTKIVKH